MLVTLMNFCLYYALFMLPVHAVYVLVMLCVPVWETDLYLFLFTKNILF